MSPYDAADAAYYQRYIVPMDAMGKPRPRVTSRGTYHTDRYTRWRAEFEHHFGPMTVEPPWALRAVVVRRMPKSWSKKKRAEMDGTPCQTTPDADNAAGAIMDVLFGQDNSVVFLEVIKLWGEEAYMDVEVWHVGAHH
jgi:Holliday junction resolvase RusA-like endonuclease